MASQCNAVYFLVESWLHDELPDEVYFIDDTMGGLPLDDRRGDDRWTPFGSTSGSSGSNGGGPKASRSSTWWAWPELFLASFAFFFSPRRGRIVL